VKGLHRTSLALLAIPLLAVLWSSVWMIAYVQPERLQLADHPQILFKYDNFVHEAGFARLAIAIIGLLVLFIPYRRGEAWAFAALVVLVVCYLLPVFFFVNFPYRLAWWLSPRLPQQRVTSLAAINFYRYLLTILALAGLGLALPQFLASRRNIRT
jgi:hypothetical protein